MKDDDTRLGFRGDSKTTVTSAARLQVQMESGKIYGPYARAEVESFIRSKRIRGEEQILFEGESSWRPISSDTEFYDVLQEVYFGVKAPVRKGELPAKSEADDKTRVSAKSAPKKHKKPQQEAKPAPSPPAPFTPEELPPAPSQVQPPNVTPTTSSEPPNPPAPPETTRKAAPPRRLLLAGVALATVLALLWSQKQGGGSAVDRPSQVGLRLSNGLAYGKPLALLMDGIVVKVPAMPPELSASSDWKFPLRFGAPAWTADLKNLMATEDTKLKSSAAFWARWAWDLLWIGSALEGLNREQGKALRESGEAIYVELGKRHLLSTEVSALFEGTLSFIKADWSGAQTSFEKAKSFEIGRWLAEEASWIAFWAAGARGNVLSSSQEYETSWLELTSRARSTFVAKGDALGTILPQIAVEDPQDYHLWFVSAEGYWRLSTDRVQLAQKFFVTGLATLSLYPVSLQAVYWEQFAEFLGGFGRQATTERALRNRDLIRSGDIESPNVRGQWWDFGQDGLDLGPLTQDVLTRLASGVVVPSDLALLQVLGFVLPAGSSALTSAAYHWAFEENWSRAEGLFERALIASPKSPLALGGQVWSYASQYRFDAAFKALDSIKALGLDPPEELKFTSLLQMIGREYDNAREGFQKYTKLAPADAWGHYFFALFHLGQQKNLDCLRSATLARTHAEGELQFRANLLFYRCRILAGVDLSNALADLRKMASKDPDNIPIQLELITGLDNGGLRPDAIHTAREVLARFPRSYELRVKLGELYEKDRSEDNAVAFYKSASRDRPNSAESWVRIARIFETQRKWKDAAATYFTAAQAEPSYPEIDLLAARAYAKAGAIEDAVRMYRREIEERPTAVASFVEAAEFMLQINAPQEVPKIFQLFKEDFQSDPHVLTRLAQAYLAMGQLDQARNTAANAIQADERLPEPHRILGIIFDKQGMYEPARKSLERYLTLLPQAEDANLIRQKLSQPPYAGH